MAMNYIDKTLLEHISIEYRYGPVLNDEQMITESHGMVPGVENYVYGIIRFFREKILPFIKDGGTYSERIRFPGVLGDFKKFFNTCDIGIIASIRDGGASWESSYDQRASSFSDGYGHVKINLSCGASTQEQLENLIATNFAHEITHAYEDFMRNKNGAPSIKDITSDDKYMSKLMTWKFGSSQNAKILGKMLYWLDGLELKAIVGQIASEINGKPVRSAKDALDAVKATNAYSIFVKLWQNTEYIMSCDDTMTRNELLSAYRIIKGKNVSWEKFVSDISERWNIWKHKFLQNAGKIAYDYFCKNQAPMINPRPDDNDSFK